MYDLLLKGGRIYDGSGLPSYLGDVAVEDGKIVETGRISGSAKRVVNADGLAVSPGFIDFHTHPVMVKELLEGDAGLADPGSHLVIQRRVFEKLLFRLAGTPIEDNVPGLQRASIGGIGGVELDLAVLDGEPHRALGLALDDEPVVAGEAEFRRLEQETLKATGELEDAVVATVAKATGSVYIITRNVDDFAGSPVPAITPADFLSELTTAV